MENITMSFSIFTIIILFFCEVSGQKLASIEPQPFPDNVEKYRKPGVFPEIPGGSTSWPAGKGINAKYGKFTLTALIWYTIGRQFCNDRPKDESPTDVTKPDLVLDQFDPFLVRYKSPEEEWYLQVTLATLNNVWCGAGWSFDIQLRTESGNEEQAIPTTPDKTATRVDILTDYQVTINIPDFSGYVRFKVLNKEKNSFEQTSGCFKYQFKDFKIEVKVTTKLIDPRFRIDKVKYRAPDINVSYSFGDAKHEMLWFPFVGDDLPQENEELGIPGLNVDKIKSILDDVFKEKILENREEFVNRYIRSVLIKLIPHIVEQCRSKVDLALSFATVLANGTDDDLYYLPPAASKLIKLGVYSVTQKNLRDKILQKFLPFIKLDEGTTKNIEKLEADYEAAQKALS